LDFASLFARSTPFRRLVVATAAAGALALLLGTVATAVPATLDGLLTDLTQRGKPALVDSVRVVTLPGNSAGTSSLSRADLARLHNRLVRAGAAAVVLQVPLNSPEAPRDLAEVRGMIDAMGANRDPVLAARLRNWAQELDHDALLEQTLRQTGRAVLVAPQQDATHASAEDSQDGAPLSGLPGLDAVNAPALPDVEAPLARFAGVAISAALTPAHIDGDGVRRHEALYFETAAGPVPSVPLAAWLLAKGISPDSLTGGESLVGNGAASLRLGGDATWLPRYGVATKLERSTAAAWLGSDKNPTNVRGKIVVVCPRSPTESVPAGRNLSRCDGTALRIASLLADDYMEQPFWGKLLAFALWVSVIAFAAIGCPALPTGGRIAAGTGLAIGITGLELWLLAEHNTVTPLMSTTLALAVLAPWVWRIRAPDRPVAESILAAAGAPFTQQRRPEARTGTAPRQPLAPTAPQARISSAQAAEVARSSRLGIELPPDHVPGQGLPGVESVTPIRAGFGNASQPATRAPVMPATVAMPTQKIVKPPAPHAGGQAGESVQRNLKPVSAPPAQAGSNSLRAISEQLNSRMLDPATTDVADLLLGRIKRPPKPKLGRYELDRELGRGAMGTVYVARDPQINRVVALKAIPLSDEANENDSDDLKSRFFREAEMAGRLAHPRIVTVYDAGEDRGIAYIAMEFLTGRTLGDFTAPDRRLQDSDVFEVTARVAEGLDYAHGQGVIHRDIKPGNIIYDTDTGSTKITDFGIARVTNSASTRTGVVLGTPSFMSPEQLEGKPLEGTSDLFSLGVTLFQLLTGQLPFRADSMTALMDKIANAPHPPLETLRPDLPPAAALVIDHALEKDPSRRFQTGAEMAAALRHCSALLAERTGAFSPESTNG
jgi:serine/threonine-protein kinase